MGYRNWRVLLGTVSAFKNSDLMKAPQLSLTLSWLNCQNTYNKFDCFNVKVLLPKKFCELIFVVCTQNTETFTNWITHAFSFQTWGYNNQ